MSKVGIHRIEVRCGGGIALAELFIPRHDLQSRVNKWHYAMFSQCDAAHAWGIVAVGTRAKRVRTVNLKPGTTSFAHLPFPQDFQSGEYTFFRLNLATGRGVLTKYHMDHGRTALEKLLDNRHSRLFRQRQQALKVGQTDLIHRLATGESYEAPDSDDEVDDESERKRPPLTVSWAVSKDEFERIVQDLHAISAVHAVGSFSVAEEPKWWDTLRANSNAETQELIVRLDGKVAKTAVLKMYRELEPHELRNFRLKARKSAGGSETFIDFDKPRKPLTEYDLLDFLPDNEKALDPLEMMGTSAMARVNAAFEKCSAWHNVAKKTP